MRIPFRACVLESSMADTRLPPDIRPQQPALDRGSERIWPERRLHEFFELLADRQPEAPAIVEAGQCLTYGGLETWANALAHALIAHGVGAREEPVGVLTDRSARLPLAFLAILKAGAVYVPMVTGLPPERLADMAGRAGMRILIALDGLAVPAALAGVVQTVLRPEEFDPACRPAHGGRPARPARSGGTGDDLAAILFTSGSTGRPKGVLLSHSGSVNMAMGHAEAQRLTAADRFLLATAPGFILGFRELCLPLVAGGAYVPASRALLDEPERLLAAMEEHGVTVALFTPSYLRLFAGAVPKGLRCLMTGGERPNGDDARHYARHLEYWNIHGATEMCGAIAMHRATPDDGHAPPSGRPFFNTTVLLLDEAGRKVPVGEAGVIHVMGAGMAHGYLGDPELTRASFVDTPWGRACRTGDLGRWRPDGLLETLGRVDDVVKVSGQSVSLGEIERTLLRHPAVERAAVLQHQGRLVAIVSGPDADGAGTQDWRDFLTRTLPAYMVPARVAWTPAMPINSAGKVDRQGLVALAGHALAQDGPASGTPPEGRLETVIARIWEEVLGVGPVMREDNFFAIGGTSLLAIAVAQRLQAGGHGVATQDVLAALTVRALAGRIEADARTPEVAAVKEEADISEGAATLSHEDFHLARDLGLAAAAGHVMRVLTLRGPVLPGPDRWRAAWRGLLERHGALRTAFARDTDGQLVWRTVAAGTLPAGAGLVDERVADLDQARQRVAAAVAAPFALDKAPLIRGGRLEVGSGEDGQPETLFWFVAHHAVVDGMSAHQLELDLLALLLDRPLPPAPNGMALAGHAEQRYLASPRAKADADYWRGALDGLLARAADAFAEIPADRARPATPSGRPAPVLVEQLDAATRKTLTRIARERGAGLHALLLALLAAEAGRRCGRRDVVIGSGVSIRPAGAEDAVGHFVNLLPMALDGRPHTLADGLRTAQDVLTGTVDHGAWPASLLYREFRQRHPHVRPPSRTSLFDLALTANSPRFAFDAGSGVTLAQRALPGAQSHPAAGLDLAFSHAPSLVEEDGLELVLHWNADVWSQDSAAAWLAAFAGRARALARRPHTLDEVPPALLPGEAARLEGLENGDPMPLPFTRCEALFAAVARRQPERPAIVTPGGTVSYGALEAQARRVAAALAGLGAHAGERVAVLAECAPALPAAVLGIWMAGAVYVPLPRELPAGRLAFMARDAKARILLVVGDGPVPEALSEGFDALVHLDRLPAAAEDDADPTPLPATPGEPASDLPDEAFVIYTSGTTGLPKGVPLPHQGLINACLAAARTTGFGEGERVALATIPGFDASLWEIGLALFTGGALVPVHQALRDDPWTLKRHYREIGVTVAFHTPSYLRLSKEVPFEGLRILFTGGEAPNHDDIRHHAPYLAFWNIYGPTETSVLVTLGRLTPDAPADRPVPAGRPLANACITIRDPGGRRVPPGVAGEVWIGGTGVARGYLDRPELDAERFVETSEGRFYRSGDIGRWTAGGLLELAGRIDHQVKLHGQRVEPGEIETALATLPGVAEAVVLVEAGAGDTRFLRAFIRVPDGAPVPAEAQWRGHLATRLPAYMVPASVTPVAAWPLTPNGKVDRGALLTAFGHETTPARGEAPRGPVETLIAGLWAGLFKAPVWRDDNFFALGGNSLLAVAMAHQLSERLGRAVSARALFAEPTLAGFAGKVDELVQTAAMAAVPATATDLATEGEREFWVAETAGLDTGTFTIPICRLVEGTVPPFERWNAAWTAVVARHEGLRTRYAEDAGGRLRRIVEAAGPVVLETAARPGRDSALALVRDRQGQPFAMAVGSLWRAGLVMVGDGSPPLFWLALHHAVGDGRSAGIIMDDLATLLDEAALLDDAPLPPLAGTFGAMAGREELYLSDEVAQTDRAFWRRTLAALPEDAFEDWPLDTPRAAAGTVAGSHRFDHRLEADEAAAIKALARRHHASPHALMLALLAAEVRRRTGRDAFLLGTTASFRETAADDTVVGCAVNMLPLPCRFGAGASFTAILGDIRDNLARALQHARLPFARIYHDFWHDSGAGRPGRRDPARYPLFDFAVTENPGGRPAAGKTSLASRAALAAGGGYERTGHSPGQDMVLVHEDLPDGGLLLQWQVNAALFTRDTAGAWGESLAGWARWLAADPDRAGVPLPDLLPTEARRLAGWERGPAIPRPALRVHEVFEGVHDRPGQAGRPAVVTPPSVLTYAGVETEANVIAHALMARGVGRGDRVGVLTGRSPGLPAAALGVWKAGATYLPLATDLPPERLAFMAGDAAAVHLLVLDGLPVPAALAAGRPPALRPEALEPAFRHGHAHRPAVAGAPDDIACILYTSGSTGRPKGVLIGHDACLNTVLGVGEAFALSPDDRTLMFSSPSFDVSLSDIGMPLAFGAALCPVPQEVLDSPDRFLAFAAASGVTVADLPPAYLRLLDGAGLPGVRILVTGGEAPVPADVARYAPTLAYYNAYGPTENAITSTMGRLSGGPDEPVTGGRPLPNTTVRIAGPDGRVWPPGAVGEIWLGGAGLARGYLNRPDLTGRAFIDTADGRFYRTGDLGRWRADGALEIRGRADDQVKLNGIRIEPGEIEHLLASHPDVAQAVAILAGTDKTRSLWAFVRLVEGRSPPSDEAWRAWLSRSLPAFMIPSAVIALARVPLTVSGKVDRMALRALLPDTDASTGGSPPEGELEILAARVWAGILGRGTVARQDNFFALGGHSLLAIAVAHRLEKELGRPVPARELFREPTLAGFARSLDRGAAAPAGTGGGEPRSDRATEGQREFWVAGEAGLETGGFTIALAVRVEGCDATPRQWGEAWDRLVARHPALRTGFRADAQGTLRCVVADTVDAAFERASLPDADSARAHIKARQEAGFAMERAGLWRAGLVRIAAANETVLWLALHHSIADGLSLGLLLGELKTLVDGGTLAVAPATDFAASAAREEAYLASDDAGRDALWWQDLLSVLPAEALEEWPLDIPRPHNPGEAAVRGSHRFSLRLDPRTGGGLRAFARTQGASLHALMLSLLATETRRRTGRGEFLLGTAASTREVAGEAEVVGYYVNMLPLPCRAEAGEPPEAALARIQKTLGEALAHTRYPFARVYQDFRAAAPSHRHRHPARYPLFDLAVTENPGAAAGEDHGTRFLPLGRLAEGVPDYSLSHAAPAQDMVLIHEGQPDGGLVLHWYVNAALYEQETARDWFRSLVEWMRLLVSPGRRPHTPLPALRAEEEARLATWEAGPALVHPVATLPRQFSRIAAADPHRPALVTDTGVTTYGAFEAGADALARVLRGLGVERGRVVGVFTGRSPALPQAVLAIWKAGGCYLPLTSDLPGDRLAFIARDAGVHTIVALDGLDLPPALAGAGIPVLRPEEPYSGGRPGGRPVWEDEPGPDDPAYIIYTSGSTGQPKGVVLRHDGMLNLSWGAARALGLGGDDRVLLTASPSFDLWISDVVMAWTVGAALVPLRRRDMDDIPGMRAAMTRLGVTAASLAPSYLRLFEGADFPGLRVLMTVGEPPNLADVRHYAGRLRYINGYGPTENTAAAAFARLKPDVRRIPAGRPLPNTAIHILDRDGRRLPPGVAGEVWLSGVGLATGYLNRPDLTAAAFVDTPEGRRYRTGDLGRWTSEGELEVLGRADGQVKLRGQRVELGEIEHRLTAWPGVRQATALVDAATDGTQTLWAFVSMAGDTDTPPAAAWTAFLAETLPSYMVPAAVLRVPAIPVTTAGKVDRTALRALLPETDASAGGSPPEGELEILAARVWAEVLSRGTVAREDNFFALGGHSLLAIAVAHRLEKELGRPVPARELFREPTLAGFARSLGRGAAAPAGTGGSEPRSDRATEGQREFWVAGEAGLDTGGFTIALAVRVEGCDATPRLWGEAWDRLVARHPALRTGFRADAQGTLRCVVANTVDAAFERTSLPDADSARAHIKARQEAGFAMERAGLWRAGLVRIVSTSETVLWLALHHSIADGLSLGLLLGELKTLVDGGTLAVAPATDFAASAAREEAYLASDDARRDASWWRDLLSALPEEALEEWPLDIPRPHNPGEAAVRGSHRFSLRLDPRTGGGLRAFARTQGASLHALMLSLLATETRRRTGRGEFLLGTAASTREVAGEAEVVGYYVNMLPLPCRAEAGEPPEAALARIQKTLGEALAHTRYPFARVYQDFRAAVPGHRHPARYPLFDLAVTENPGTAAGEDHGTRFLPLDHLDEGVPDYALSRTALAQDMVLIHEGLPDGGLVLHWYVNAALYEQETARDWFRSLVEWMRLLVSPGRRPHTPLPALRAEEEARLAAWEAGPALVHPVATLPRQFSRIVAADPHRPAVVTDAGVTSYGAFDAGADALARVLRGLGVERGRVVGVFTGRSPALPQAVLAIWKAGGCYLPLTSDLPGDRLAFIARDAGVHTIVALDGLALPPALAGTGIPVLRPEEPHPVDRHSGGQPVWEDEPGPDDPAYIIYTSGSTGQPKGVVLRHDGMLNLGWGGARALDLGEDDRVLLTASPSFDLWISDVVMAWTVGAALVPLRRRDMDDIPGMRAAMTRLGVTAASLAPSYLRLFEGADFPGLRVLMTVGEPPNLADVRHYAGRLRYINGYGPTENTAAAAFARLKPDVRRIPAGRPLPNTAIHILDRDGRRLPPGVAGEVWLSGVGLATGYLNRPDLTAAAFVDTPEGRRYRTGDLGRWTSEGELEVLGRADGQVKLRGQRVELGEIEHRLTAWPGVRQATALVDAATDGTQTLWAFVSMAGDADTPPAAAWTAFLAETLPSYMVPAAVLRVPAIPVTTAGKVDRKALLAELAASPAVAPGAAAGRAPPQGVVETRIAEVWAGRFQRPFIARDDDFFELGGDSLSAIAVVNQLRCDFECRINDLYEHPVLADFARTCRPRAEHLAAVIATARAHWQAYHDGLAAYDAAREQALAPALAAYETRNGALADFDPEARRGYRRVLLTGATGYLGSYLLRALLARDVDGIIAVVRGGDEEAARARLARTLRYYFGDEDGAALAASPKLAVVAGDLGREGLGLDDAGRRLVDGPLDAIIHCAANVNHIGHYHASHTDNVDATARLLALAARDGERPADFHFVSTLSVAGKAPEEGFRLFSEYDPPPTTLDENYYVRTKQEAERLVREARGRLANASIHRVGNVVYAAEGGPLQRNPGENAFFRRLASFIRLGQIPDDMHLWLCHVDLVALSIVRLAWAAGLTNETHHIENARCDTLAGFITSSPELAGQVTAVGFGPFLDHLARIAGDPGMHALVTDTLETMGLFTGRAPQPQARRLEVVTARTQMLLARLGLLWPPVPPAGQAAMLRAAASLHL
jgi:amino acid adenylation domain-containing protein/thioester reductase-like protein